MTENKGPDLEARLALDIFLRKMAGQYPQVVYRRIDEDMEPSDDGPYIRRLDGTYGDWYSEVYEPALRARPRPPRNTGGQFTREDNGRIFWTGNAGEVRYTDMGEGPQAAVEEVPPLQVPQVQRYRCISSSTKITIRACKEEAKEILTEICKD